MTVAINIEIRPPDSGHWRTAANAALLPLEAPVRVHQVLHKTDEWLSAIANQVLLNTAQLRTFSGLAVSNQILHLAVQISPLAARPR